MYAQVDGEPVGPLPITFRIVPDAISLVTPAQPKVHRAIYEMSFSPSAEEAG